LMARESLAGNARNLFIRTYGDPGSGYRFASRNSTGGATVSNGSGGTNGFPNAWIRLTRVGNVFTGYASTDGVTWTQIGSAVTMSLPSTIYLGLAVSSRSASATSTVQFRDISLI
jgi:hypothetical protein